MSRPLIATAETVASRLAECTICRDYRRSTGQCMKCGCFVRVKVRLAFAKCPVGKW